jgi:hypothetical protein
MEEENIILKIFKKGLNTGKEVDREVWECEHRDNLINENGRRYRTELQKIIICKHVFWVGECPEGCLFWMKDKLTTQELMEIFFW